MKIKTDNYIKKVILSKLINEKYYHKIKLYKIIIDYLIGNDYENCKKLFALIIKKDSIVLDIGANMGQYACRLSKFIKTGKIYSFEPFYPNFNSLRSMKKILQLINVKPIHCAISDKRGKLKLLIPIINNTLIVGTQAVLSQYQSTCFKNAKYIEEYVDSTTIDDFVLENKLSHVDFIKIDTEGAEIPILKGGLETIKKYLPVLSVEIHPSNIELIFLYELGYKPYTMLNGKLISFNQDYHKLKGNAIFINQTGSDL